MQSPVGLGQRPVEAMASHSATALETLNSMAVPAPRRPESPSSLSLGNGLGSSLPSIGLRSLSASGLPHMGSFGGGVSLEEVLGELAQAQPAAVGQHQQQEHGGQHVLTEPLHRPRLSEQQCHQQRLQPPQRLRLPPASLTFPRPELPSHMDGAKSTEEIWRSIHGGLHGSGLGPGAWPMAPSDVAGNRVESDTRRLSSSLHSVPSAATHFANAGGGSVATLSGRSTASLAGGSRVVSSAARISGAASMHGFSGSTEMASHMAAAALAAGADPSWFPHFAGGMGGGSLGGGGGGGGGGLPSLDHALQTAVMANGLSASGSPDPMAPHAAPQSYGRGQFGGGSNQPYRGSHSLELPPYTSIAPPSSHGGADMRSTSIDTAMELTRSLQQKFIAESRRGSVGAPPRPYHLPQRFMEPEAMAAALSSGAYAGAPPASGPRQTSPPASSPRFHAEAAVTAADAPLSAAQRRAGRAPRGASSLPRIGSEALSMRSMPRIPPASGPPPGRFDSHTLANSGSVPAASGGGSISARERHKLTKGRTVDVDEKELRDMKRKEANRESAARSRDKRLKLIADLETEVQELKRQHEAFKERVIQTTVPRELVEAPAARQRGAASALRRANTDPLDAAHRIADALGGRPPAVLNVAALPPPAAAQGLATVSEGPSWSDGKTMAAPLVSGLSCDSFGTGELALPAGAGMYEPASEPASRADAALLRPWKA